eukprot:2669468-Rhodomonas_salina.15
MRAVSAACALMLLCAAASNANPTRFTCSRSMAVGEVKPMDQGNTIEIMNDRSIDTVGGQNCGGSLITGTAHALAINLPSSSYQWLIEAKGVTAVYSNPFTECSDRMFGTGASAASSNTLTFSSTGTVTLRLLASLGSGSPATTGAAPECTFTVTAAPVDECSDGTDNCDDNAACTNTDASFTCACSAGWETADSGVTCTDI